MKSTTLLRMASILAFLQFSAHTLLFVTSAPSHGPEEIALVEAMKSHRFDFMGSPRSYWDFYFGYGLFAAFNCLIQAVLFWQLATFAKTDASRIRPVVALFLLANVGYAILASRYFFVTPIVPDIAIATCLGLALMTARPSDQNAAGKQLERYEPGPRRM